MATTLDRRAFLKVSVAAGGGLVVGGYLSDLVGAPTTVNAGGVFEPNVWVRIAADDTVTMTLTMLEMGQGVMTSMPMLVAEELDVDWNRIKTVWAPADPRYGNPNFGGMQLTAGSNSVRGMWKLLREAGATARAMLITAAAQSARRARVQPHHRHRRSHPRGQRTPRQVRGARGRGRRAPGAAKRHPQGARGLQAARQVDAPARHPGEGERHGRVRPRREAPGAARRARRQVPGVRGQGGWLQRREGEGGSGRHERRPDQQRDRRGRHELLGRLEGRPGPRGEVGRGRAGDADERRHHEALRPARGTAGQRRAQRRRRRTRR